MRVEPAQSNPEDILSGRGMEGEVESALNKLPEEFREAIMLVDVEELSYQEVAGVLDVPIGTVKSRVSRGRAILREALTRFAKERGIIRS
jgi:RNA polymerase sigma-70 factor (ECF subfamily)